MLEGYRSPFDATVVSKLKSEGMVCLGKLNCDEFAMGSANENSTYGKCFNPWDPQAVPGGSSGGSASAVAAVSPRSRRLPIPAAQSVSRLPSRALRV